MKIYVVGGVVRDKLLDDYTRQSSTPVDTDIDFVVTGADDVQMKLLGYTQVGNDFPVFLHPDTHNEYALARRERKTRAGYNGFSFDIDDVTIEEDLSRRDLTINAMAVSVSDNDYSEYSMGSAVFLTSHIIDPFNGADDIKHKILRAVSLDTFVEDPVRVLRLARFAAKFGEEWTIDPETLDAAKKVVASDEWQSLTSERVYKEMSKTFSTCLTPDIFFRVLEQVGENYWFKEVMDCRQCPQPAKHHPEGDVFEHTMQGLRVCSTKLISGPNALFAILCHDLGKPVTYKERGNLHGHEEAGLKPTLALCERLGVNKQEKKTALDTTKYHLNMHRILELRATTIVKMFEKIGVFHHTTDPVPSIIDACEADARARNNADSEYPQSTYIHRLMLQVRQLKTPEKIVSGEVTGLKARDLIYQMRVEIIKRTLSEIRDENENK